MILGLYLVYYWSRSQIHTFLTASTGTSQETKKSSPRPLSPPPIPLRCIATLASRLRLYLLFSLGFTKIILYEPSSSPMRAICFTNLDFLNLTMLRVLGGEYKL